MTSRHKQAPQGHHGQDAIPDRGRKYGTKVQEVPMAGQESGYRYRFAKDKNITDGVVHDKDVIRGKR